MTEPRWVSVNPNKIHYLGTSQKHQDILDGLDEDDDEEIRLHRKDMERDNSFLINHDGDIALPSYEQDDDYTEDRYPQENTDDLPTWRVSYPPRWVSVK